MKELNVIKILELKLSEKKMYIPGKIHEIKNKLKTPQANESNIYKNPPTKYSI